MNFTIEHEQETDGRWLAEVMELPGVMAYGDSAEDAVSKAEALAKQVIESP
jgi:predicted RNase H-like HicB family nuclease